MKLKKASSGARAHAPALPRATQFAHTKIHVPDLDRSGSRHPIFATPNQPWGKSDIGKHAIRANPHTRRPPA